MTWHSFRRIWCHSLVSGSFFLPWSNSTLEFSGFLWSQSSTDTATMAKRTFDLLGHVRPAHEFDLNALLHYCSAYVPAFPPSPSNFRVSQVRLRFPSPLRSYCSNLIGVVYWRWLILCCLFSSLEISSDMANQIRLILSKLLPELLRNGMFWGRNHRGRYSSLLMPLKGSFRC